VFSHASCSHPRAPPWDQSHRRSRTPVVRATAARPRWRSESAFRARVTSSRAAPGWVREIGGSSSIPAVSNCVPSHSSIVIAYTVGCRSATPHATIVSSTESLSVVPCIPAACHKTHRQHLPQRIDAVLARLPRALSVNDRPAHVSDPGEHPPGVLIDHRESQRFRSRVDTVRSPRLLRATFTSPESQLAQAVAPGAPKRRGIGRLALHAEGRTDTDRPRGRLPARCRPAPRPHEVPFGRRSVRELRDGSRRRKRSPATWAVAALSGHAPSTPLRRLQAVGGSAHGGTNHQGHPRPCVLSQAAEQVSRREASLGLSERANAPVRRAAQVEQP
jgi:hypothetical protein